MSCISNNFDLTQSNTMIHESRPSFKFYSPKLARKVKGMQKRKESEDIFLQYFKNENEQTSLSDNSPYLSTHHTSTDEEDSEESIQFNLIRKLSNQLAHNRTLPERFPSPEKRSKEIESIVFRLFVIGPKKYMKVKMLETIPEQEYNPFPRSPRRTYLKLRKNKNCCGIQ